MPRNGSPDAEPTRLPSPPTFMNLPSRPTHEELDVVLLGIPGRNPAEPGVDRDAATRDGPGAIRLASASLHPYNPLLAVDVNERLAAADLGDLVPRAVLDPGPEASPNPEPGPEEAGKDVEHDPLAALARAGIPWIALGGDGGVLIDELRALAAVYGPLALVRLDAHHGLGGGDGEAGVTSESVLRRALEEGLVDASRSLVAGLRGPLRDPSELGLPTELGIDLLNYEELAAIGPGGFAQRAHARLGGARSVVSLDIDFLDPAFAPGTASPVVGGPSSREALTFVRSLAGLDIRAFDCLGVAPGRDPAGTTALVAASACFEMLSLAAVRHG